MFTILRNRLIANVISVFKDAIEDLKNFKSDNLLPYQKCCVRNYRETVVYEI